MSENFCVVVRRSSRSFVVSAMIPLTNVSRVGRETVLIWNGSECEGKRRLKIRMNSVQIEHPIRIIARKCTHSNRMGGRKNKNRAQKKKFQLHAKYRP